MKTYKSGMNKKILFCIIITLIPFLIIASNEKPLRRHIILAVDASGSFQSNDGNVSNDRNSLFFNITALLKGEEYPIANIANDIFLKKELKNNIPFFDIENDDLSLFVFSMAENKRIELRRKYRLNQDSSSVRSFIDDFNSGFLHYIANYKERGLTLNQFIDEKISPTFGGTNEQVINFMSNSGITLSQFVYPSILEYINDATPAREYILIVMSDFRSGGYGSSREDWERVAEITGNESIYYNGLNSFINNLSATFYRLDYFDFVYGRLISLGYKIKPMVGVNNPEDVALTIESDFNLYQQEFGENKYLLDPVTIKFTHNKDLKIKSIDLNVYDNANEKMRIFHKQIAYLMDGYLKAYNGEKLKYDILKYNYTFPELIMDLDDITNEGLFKELEFVYDIEAYLDFADNKSLSYIYQISRNVSSSSVGFVTPLNIKIKKVLMIITPILFLLILLVILYYVAAKRGLIKVFNIDPIRLGDKYMRVENSMVVDLGVWFWKKNNTEFEKRIPISGFLKKDKNIFTLNWNYKAQYWIEDIDDFDDFDFYNGNGVNFSKKDIDKDTWPVLPLDKDNKFIFNAIVRYNANVSTKPNFDQAIILKFKMKVKVTATLFGCKSKSFVFGVGEQEHKCSLIVVPEIEMPEMWVGLDPGTSGSCVALGKGGHIISDDNIAIIAKPIRKANGEKGYEQIFPSLLILDKEINKDISEYVPGIDYLFGLDADREWSHHIKRTPNCFQSVKKMLGYDTDKKAIALSYNGNKNIKQIKGVELAYLIVKGLYHELTGYVEELPYTDKQKYLNEEYSFNPQRAVVAVPNNFTLPKIQAMVDSVKMLEQFKEVRYIFESEAVLFSYIQKEKPTKGIHTILIYDMGAATINATLFKVEVIESYSYYRYEIETIGKIGYAVGGDNIDYALMEIVFGMPSVLKYLNECKNCKTIEDIEQYKKKNKSSILLFVKELKLDFIDYKNGIVSEFNIFQNDENFLNLLKKININLDALDENDKEWIGKQEVKKHIINEIVFDNIKDAIEELLRFAKDPSFVKIDDIVFSGRSTLYPRIRETVLETLKSSKVKTPDKSWNDFSNEELKTTVARGACWFGMFGQHVDLKYNKITSSYGFSRLERDNKAHFVEIIKRNSKYKDQKITTYWEAKDNTEMITDFISFYQMLGSNEDEILNKNIKHKMNLLAEYKLDNPVKYIEITIDTLDNISGKYEDVTKTFHDIDSENISISTKDITNENAPAYLFAISNEEIEIGTHNSDITNNDEGIF